MLVIGVSINLIGRFVYLPLITISIGEDFGIGWFALLTIFLGAFVLLRGRQIGQMHHIQMDMEDERAPILYLRSFREDTKISTTILTSIFWGNLMQGLTSVEGQLSKAVEKIGPFLAIGRPGEDLPALGTPKLYARQQKWQTNVEKLMLQSRIVLLKAGNSPGLRWEINTCFSKLEPQNLAVWVQMSKKQYQAFRTMIKQEVQIDLPPYSSLDKSIWGGIRGFFHFGENWEPDFRRLKAPFWRLPANKPLTAQFHYALKPVFEAQNITWDPFPIAVGKVLSLGFLSAVLFFSLAFLISYSYSTNKYLELDTGYGSSDAYPENPETSLPVEEATASMEGTTTDLPEIEKTKNASYKDQYQIKVPFFLEEVSDLNQDASLQFASYLYEFYVIVIDDSKEEAEAWLSEWGGYDNNRSVFQNYHTVFLSEVIEGIYGGEHIKPVIMDFPAMENAVIYEFTFSSDNQGSLLHAFMISALLEGERGIYEMYTWTLEENKEEFRDQFLKIISSFEEL